MIDLVDAQTFLVDAQPYVLIFLVIIISIGLLPDTQDMLDSVLNYIWRSSSTSSSGSRSSRRLEKYRRGGPRTRAQQAAARNEANGTNEMPPVKMEVELYPGLVNMSGTYCFLNSPLQALASLAYLQTQMDSNHEKAEQWDVPSPVTDAIGDLLNDLNTPRSHKTALRPVNVIKALSMPDSTGKRTRSRLFSSREHQDAQELFQLLSSSIKDEANEIDAEAQKDLGLAAVDRSEHVALKDASKTVFEGLTANRRSCVTCGYTEAVMHFPFDNLNLAVPRMQTCTLQDCLAAYTQIELLNDCVCRKCSVVATFQKLKAEAERLSATASHPDASANRKKRAKEALRLSQRVQIALEENKIEDDIKDVKLERVYSPCSTKQVMIARPPSVLVIHLNRSSYYGYGAAHKNSCRVNFPEILDLTPYTTSGALSTKPQSPISAHQSATSYILNSFSHDQDPSSPTSQSSGPSGPGSSSLPVLYRLSAVVCHYGGHSFGHYVCFRRKPGAGLIRPTTPGRPKTLKRPRINHPLTCSCSICQVHGRVRDSNHDEDYDPYHPPSPHEGWLRISDDSVEEVGLQRVLVEAASAFMLFYERVVIRTKIRDKDRPKEVEAEVSEAKLGNGVALAKTGTPVDVDTKSKPYIHQEMGHAVSTNVTDVETFSPRSSEETITPENARLASPTSPIEETRPPWAEEPIVANGKPSSRAPSTDQPSARDAAQSVPLPHSDSPAAVRGRIVRSVSSPRSRKTSASSMSIYHTVPSNGTSTPKTPLISSPSPVYTDARSRQESPTYTIVTSEPPSRSETQTSEAPSGKKSRSASRKQAKAMNGAPDAPPRTIDTKA